MTKDNRRSFIIVKTQYEAIHYWNEATGFLKHPHHHRFYVTLEIETIPGDNDRTFEFFEVRGLLDASIQEMLKRQGIDRQDAEFIPTLKGISTEKMSDFIHEYLIERLAKRYPFIKDIEYCPPMSIKVMEDNYGGSKTMYYPEESK